MAPMSAQPLPELTFEDDLKFEELSSERHEFVGGQVFVMSGGTEVHDLLVQALNARMYGPFRTRGCRPGSCRVVCWGGWGPFPPPLAWGFRRVRGLVLWGFFC